MKLKTLSIAALSLALIGGVAHAQTTNSTTSDPAASQEGPDPSQKKLWQPFFTDDTFSSVRTNEELRTAFMGMSTEDQAAMKTECTATSENKEKFWPEGADAICEQIGTY